MFACYIVHDFFSIFSKIFASNVFSRHPTKTDFCVNILYLILLDFLHDTSSLQSGFVIYLIFVRKSLSSSYSGCCFGETRKKLEFQMIILLLKCFPEIH